ncbi:histone deacetylase 6-like [Chenopodium quinoa]|uniref:UBP-type domain-containing protein n=1 Tax=Chenopodium quinoa TaxID=63459 RepID=A0A803M2Q6_CHEQI|nr:histone deacetylase 6-like [Chenopodium quinoa]
MAGEACSSSSAAIPEQFEDEEDLLLYGGGSGWVEPRTWCEHLPSLTSDLSHIPTPDTSCFRCHHPAENWVCLFCKDVLCSRFINKHMLEHYEQKGHCLALSYSDLSVWCFTCDAYLDAQVIQQLRVAYETAYLLKFGESPPVRTMKCMLLEDTGSGSSS